MVNYFKDKSKRNKTKIRFFIYRKSKKKSFDPKKSEVLPSLVPGTA